MLTAALILVVFSWITPLKAQSQEQVERFKKEREAFFTKNLELTTEESEAFFCVYDDFFNRKMKLAEDERNTFSYAYDNAENLSDKEITEILEKIRTIKEDQVKLENQYFQDKFTEVLPPKKVLKLYRVEWDFRRHLLRQLRDQTREEDDRNRRSNRGGGGESPMGSNPEPFIR